MEDKKNKKKMRAKKFAIIWSCVSVVLLGGIITATTLMNFYNVAMDTYLGKGARHEVTNSSTQEWDTNYYDQKYTDLNDAIEDSAEIALNIAREGIVLLKNKENTLPLVKQSKVSPMGYRYLNPVYGGTGSGGVDSSQDYVDTAEEMMHEFFDVNTTLETALKNNNNASRTAMTATGYTKENESGGFSGGTATILEYEPSIYDGTESSMAGTTGVVFIGRVGGEGGDVQSGKPGSSITDGYYDGTKHQLRLSEYEKSAIRLSKENCDKTVIVINSSNIMEVNELLSGELEADAILWIGGPGAKGFRAMAEIMCGDVNPSGKTPDLWMNDFTKDPTYSNFGNYAYSNVYVQPTANFFDPSSGSPVDMKMMEYEEGIYLGYKYYETVDDTNGSFAVFDETGCTYDQAVAFPFGYGLSYGSSFSQEITNIIETDTQIQLTVNVTNTGTRAGKDVVQVYFNAPYTQFDVTNKIEKATVNLVEFAKTGDIQPNASETVTITFDKEDMASYCYTHTNPDNTLGAYVLEGGDYKISVNKNSHEEYDSETINIASTIWYDNTNPRQSEKDGQALLDDNGVATNVPAKAESDPNATFKSASNLWQDLTDHMLTRDLMTRGSGTLVNNTTSPTEDELIAPFDQNTPATSIAEGVWDSSQNKFKMTALNPETDTYLGNVPSSKVYVAPENMPTTNADNGLTLSSFRGVNYYDPLWDDLLDQLDLSESTLYRALGITYNQIDQIESIGKPASVEFDGPQSLQYSGGRGCAWTSEPILAATFNRELAYQRGEAVAQEALIMGVNGWYAPAVNIHRSPFSGRNFEYFSEDPILSGKLASRTISGAGDNGLYVTLKHFAVNDQEMYNNDRSRVATWADEQTLRELYLKPFEIAVKESRMKVNYISDDQGTVSTKIVRGCTGMMSSMNYLGFIGAISSYELNTELLRDEWGFQGLVMTDMSMNAGSTNESNNRDQALRSGNDNFMAFMGDVTRDSYLDTESATAVTAIRKAVKNMAYTLVNSNAFNNVAPGTSFYYDMSPWRIGLIIANVVVYVGIASIAGLVIYRIVDNKKNPDRYKSKKVKAN